ncbi:recombination regulator RecX [Vagococcus jeotgali]|uniref:recombination regulator RecX n=1 Tax=Vagococcus jeotgali TaxID=3109030 RepID=UPI002DD8D4CD|nr:recombination regulator RecX [Vagococcus sp. B2T-5]
MEIIKSTKKLKRGGYQIKTESGMVIRVSEDSLVKHRLLKGQELSKSLLEQIEREADFDIGYQKALAYLSYQLRSEKEIKDHLKKHEVSEEQIYLVIDKLRELQLLNDAEFAKSYVRTAMRTTDKGPSGVKEFLFKKGIKQEEIQEALSLFDEDSQYPLALNLAEKNMRKNRQKSQQETKNKLNQFLYGKGFSSEVISRVIDEVITEVDEDEEYEKLKAQGDKLWRRHERLEPYKRKQKIKQSLYQKGFSMDDINRYIDEKEMELD